MPYKDPEQRRAYYAATREKQIERAARWAKDNRDKNNATRRASYAADPTSVRGAVYAWRDANPEMFAYTTHKHHAKRRDIPFLLTFDEWIAIWHESGKFTQRGHKKGQYVMARHGDLGPYAVGNVRICTCSENITEWHDNRRKRRHD